MLAPFWLQFCGSNRYFEDKRGTKDARLTTCVNWYNFRGNGFRQDPHGRLCDNIHSRGNRYDSVADTSWTKLGRGDENCPIDSIPRVSITFINVLSKHYQTHNGPKGFAKITAFKSCHNLVKSQLQNLDQTLASKTRPKRLKSWPIFGYKIWTKLQPQNDDQTSASESWPNFSFAKCCQHIPYH